MYQKCGNITSVEYQQAPHYSPLFTSCVAYQAQVRWSGPGLMNTSWETFSKASELAWVELHYKKEH